MFKESRLLNLLVCAVFGLVGGISSHLVLTTKHALAQQTSTVVRAERFELIDDKGKTRAILRRNTNSNEAELVLIGQQREVALNPYELLFSYAGRERIALGSHSALVNGGPARDPAQYQLLIYGENGKVKHALR